MHTRLSILGLAIAFTAACGTPKKKPVASDATGPRTPVPTASAAPPDQTPDTPPAATMLFCAYGGVGLVPDPLPPGYETMFASIVVQIDNAGAPRAGVSVSSAALLDASGSTLASLRRVDHLVAMPPLATPGPTRGTFAVYLNPEGTPFDGELPTGRTTVRVRFSLDRTLSVFAARCRLKLGGLGATPFIVEGRVDGVWGN